MHVTTRYINSTRGISCQTFFLYLEVHKLQHEAVPLVEFMYLVFTCMPGESYHRRLRSLLSYMCCVFQVLINSLVCWLCRNALGLVLFQIFAGQDNGWRPRYVTNWPANLMHHMVSLSHFALEDLQCILNEEKALAEWLKELHQAACCCIKYILSLESSSS